MQILNVEACSKSYGEKLLFEDISFSISKSQKIALIAKNGTGKSTLLRIIAGEESPEGERANIEFNPGISTYFLKQEPNFHKSSTVLECIYESDNPKILAVQNYAQAILEKNQKEIENQSLILDDLKAWDTEVRIKEVLSKFNITDLEKTVGQLSGGQVKRLAIAKMIINEPDFIVLDEPTNHLDMDMIEWLEDYLQTNSITLFMVTHDRYFLERICSEMFELENGELFTYRGNYSDYLEKKEARIQNEQSQLYKAKKLYKRELDWIRRMPKARTSKSKSRVDKFSEIKKQAFANREESNLSIQLKASRLGSKILEAHAISKSYGDLKIIESFSYKFKRGERVGIVGKNGVGKSTFLDILTQKTRPDGGKIVLGETIKFGYYTQDGIKLNEDKRVIEVIRDIAEYIPLEKGQKLTAESLLETFLFPRSQQQVYISQLSGGEKRRLYLLTVLMENPNFLIMDEPTNDLDILTLNVLEDYLLSFPGCLLVVSHDRFFLDKMVDHLFILEGEGKIKDYNQTYSEYRSLQKAALPKQVNHEKDEGQKAEAKLDRDQQKKIKNRINKIEREIASFEEKKEELTTQFSGDLSLEEIQQKSIELEETKDKIGELEMEWLELSEKFEN